LSRRFIIPSIPNAGEFVEVSDPAEVKHLRKSLRLNIGDEITVSDGQSKSASAEITAVNKNSVMIRILETKTAHHTGSKLTLWLGCLKSPRMDWLVEKLVELNVDEFRPLICEHSVAVKDKKERWERIAKAALKQSGADRLVAIHDAVPLSAVSGSKNELFIYLSLDKPQPAGLAEILQAKNADQIHLFVGPEGGFSPNELAHLKEIGAVAASLGSAVLRGETAGIVACGIARHWIDFLCSKKI
jgi:16S rRNA (uracil1498-N3)-methyltransferase